MARQPAVRVGQVDDRGRGAAFHRDALPVPERGVDGLAQVVAG
jgi:hypothetical protein